MSRKTNKPTSGEDYDPENLAELLETEAIAFICGETPKRLSRIKELHKTLPTGLIRKLNKAKKNFLQDADYGEGRCEYLLDVMITATFQGITSGDLFDLLDYSDTNWSEGEYSEEFYLQVFVHVYVNLFAFALDVDELRELGIFGLFPVDPEVLAARAEKDRSGEPPGSRCFGSLS